MKKCTEKLWIDLETCGADDDLIANGLDRYASNPDTHLICLSYAFNDEPPRTWFPEDGHPIPQHVHDHIASGGLLFAHNARFERLMFEYVLCEDYGLPDIDPTQWRCSAAVCMANGIPSSLADMGTALRLKIRKQKEGTRLIREYCLNGGQGWKGNDRFLMQNYCEADVATMRLGCSVMRELTEEEWAEYHLNERINDRGVPVDVAFATAALDYSAAIKATANDDVKIATRNKVKTTGERKSRDEWLLPLLTDGQIDLITVSTEGKPDKISMDKEHREALAAAPNLPAEVGKYLTAVSNAGGSSIAKYKVMVNTHMEGRVHGAVIWHRAGTGRFGGKGLQLHNFPRDVIITPDPLINKVLKNEPLIEPGKTLSRLLRAAITSPEGITYGDWAQIEPKICGWLANSDRAEPFLGIFRKDRDLYTETAKGMGMDDRQAGKIASLSLMFGGGANALIGMAKGYGTFYTLNEAQSITQNWRRLNHWAVIFWKRLHRAAVMAFKDKGEVFTAGRLKFVCTDDWLIMVRPSGNVQMYYKPKIEKVEYPWGGDGFELTVLASSIKPPAGSKKWPRRVLTQGTLIENATQATAADLLREALTICDDENLPVLFSCHDEIIIEGHYAADLHKIMQYVPDWAEGIPLKTAVTYTPRYGK